MRKGGGVMARLRKTPQQAAESVDESFRDIVLNGTVTGKANATMVTGGTASIGFYDENDNYLGGFELYKGLLVTRDGMYRIE